MQTSALFGEKTSEFSKFMVCPHEQGGGGQFFAICVDVLYEQPL